MREEGVDTACGNLERAASDGSSAKLTKPLAVVHHDKLWLATRLLPLELLWDLTCNRGPAIPVTLAQPRRSRLIASLLQRLGTLRNDVPDSPCLLFLATSPAKARSLKNCRICLGK